MPMSGRRECSVCCDALVEITPPKVAALSLFGGPLSVASRREVRAQDELALETARLNAAVCLGDLIEGDPLSDVRLDRASC